MCVHVCKQPVSPENKYAGASDENGKMEVKAKEGTYHFSHRMHCSSGPLSASWTDF